NRQETSRIDPGSQAVATAFQRELDAGRRVQPLEDWIRPAPSMAGRQQSFNDAPAVNNDPRCTSLPAQIQALEKSISDYRAAIQALGFSSNNSELKAWEQEANETTERLEKAAYKAILGSLISGLEKALKTATLTQLSDNISLKNGLASLNPPK